MALLNGGAIRVSGRLTANEPGVAKASDLEGQGIAFLPSAAATGELNTGMLTPVLPELIGADIPVRLVHAGRNSSIRKCTSSLIAQMKSCSGKYPCPKVWKQTDAVRLTSTTGKLP
ncbi:DNA-binding transcriptional LysR family regulator [Labrenzia sp. EL_142]|nr:DNA-binding transcriptional LysR family regulator [Labrenzia sp. EL_142]